MAELKSGVRLRCGECGTEVIVIQPPEPADTVISCGDAPMVPIEQPDTTTGR